MCKGQKLFESDQKECNCSLVKYYDIYRYPVDRAWIRFAGIWRPSVANFVPAIQYTYCVVKLDGLMHVLAQVKLNAIAALAICHVVVKKMGANTTELCVPWSRKSTVSVFSALFHMRHYFVIAGAQLYSQAYRCWSHFTLVRFEASPQLRVDGFVWCAYNICVKCNTLMHAQT